MRFSTRFALLAAAGMAVAMAPADGETGSDTGGTGTAKPVKKEPTINTVTLTDGRIVDFVGKRKLLKASEVTPDGKIQTTLDFVNGETRTFTIPDALLAKFASHGAEQKLGDEIAGVDDIEDAVMAIDDLIDRLYSPRRFLADVTRRLNPGGLLLLASPYTWLEEHTKREEWIGGFKKDGESYTTLDGLKDLLAADFELVQGPQAVPFVIRETRRKHQHTLSELTIWRKRA